MVLIKGRAVGVGINDRSQCRLPPAMIVLVRRVAFLGTDPCVHVGAKFPSRRLPLEVLDFRCDLLP